MGLKLKQRTIKTAKATPKTPKAVKSRTNLSLVLLGLAVFILAAFTLMHLNWASLEKDSIALAKSYKFQNILHPSARHQHDSTRSVVAFQNHPSHVFANGSNLVSYMSFLAKLPQCSSKPLFVTMARVHDDLYWQLIENFFHTMLKYGHLDCTVMICVTDSVCMEKCNSRNFPCFNYEHHDVSAHVMEQVAEVKLLHIGLALEAGVNILLLDLDVGFLRDPLLLYEGFLDNPYEQVRAQMDMGFSTEKVSNTWFTHPRPNFGLFMVKSHQYSVKAFKNAWKLYKKINDTESKTKVATDQNTIVNSLKWARWRWGYNFSYFYLGFMLDTYPRPIIPLKALLLDKMDLATHHGIRNELGGSVAAAELGDAVAVHATCHEGSTKLLGLKAANAFWNSDYYLPHRRTITKPIMFLSARSMLQELKSLALLAVLSNRTLIIPNIIIGVGTNVGGQLTQAECATAERSWSMYCQELYVHRNRFSGQNQSHAAINEGEYYWPAWRTLQIDYPELIVVEPAYYYRIEHDMKISVPRPHLHRFDHGQQNNFDALLANVKSVAADRLVLDVVNSSTYNSLKYSGGPGNLVAWAKDSTSSWGSDVTKYSYLSLPNSPPHHILTKWEDQITVCQRFLVQIPGNRSCFDKCR